MAPTVLIAPDTYKGSLDAAAAGAAIARGLAAGWPQAALDVCPLSDGGAGFIEALVRAGDGTRADAETTDALGRPIRATYGLLEGGRTLVVELSSAAGLATLEPDRRDPLVTTTYGVGTLIRDAQARHGCTRLLLALGGSATVDGGAGLLAALGVRFLDDAGDPIPLGGGGLARLARVDADAAPAWWLAMDVRLAVDVTNPLLGPRGAARVYGPQKGAGPAEVEALEAALTRYAEVLAAATGLRTHDLAGAGSAGGVPAGLVALAGARMTPGFELAATAVGLDARLARADWVITGEGQLDRSSFEGKVVGRLASRCRDLGLPLTAVVGHVEAEGEALLAQSGGAAVSLVPGPMDLARAMANAEALLERTGRALGRLGGALYARAGAHGDGPLPDRPQPTRE